VHVVGAGPVGLLLTALLQPMEGFSVRLYEKRQDYTRTRMVQLAPYLVADSIETYRTDPSMETAQDDQAQQGSV
jgi:2-polyprenyl-6-methoxyphenol hydroxylase-like FAD-dependent oxidoreductase